MSLHELRAELGLLLAIALIIGGSLGIGLPLAAVHLVFILTRVAQCAARGGAACLLNLERPASTA